MSSENIQNINYFDSSKFKFVIKRSPHLQFFAQNVNLPEMNIAPVQQATPFVDIKYSGDKITYEPLVVTFKMDEDFKTYISMYNWFRGLGFPDDNIQYANLKNENPFLGGGRQVDVSIVVLNSAMNGNFEFVFKDAFPIKLGSFTFSTTNQTAVNPTLDVAFAYTSYELFSL